MKERSDRDQMDPIGWWYQSRIHGNPMATGWQPGEPTDWSQCRHGTWFFLPWHRIYLMQFERIIRNLTGEQNWALPYWDYPDASHATVPPQFGDETSPLYDSTRTLHPINVAPPTWQRQATFQALGGRPQESPQTYHRGRFPGQLELNPHNPVHGYVGGDMAGFQSPLDPIFWIHHCNIDRLWEVWLTLPDHANPTEDEWRETTFEFPDPDPEHPRRTVRVADVETLAAAGYSYDDLTPPGSALVETRLLAMTPRRHRKDDRLELIGAAGGGSVRGPRQVIPIEATAAQNRLLGAEGVDAAEIGLFLLLENAGIDGGDASSMWNVYVRLGDTGQRHLAGTISPFGLAGLTESGGRQTITFDISELAADVVNVEAAPLEISFEPAGADVEGEPYWERAALYTTAG